MTSVDKWMTTQVVTVNPNDSLGRARTLMSHGEVRQLPVVVGEQLVGMLSDRDIRDATPSVFESPPGEGAHILNRIRVEDVMTYGAVSVPPWTPLTRAASILQLHKVGALPVTFGRRLVGIISHTDILRAVAAQAEPTELPAECYLPAEADGEEPMSA